MKQLAMVIMIFAVAVHAGKGFAKQFLLCEEDADTTVEVTNFGTFTYYYKIIGETEEGCKVMSKYLTNADSSLVGKEIECILDNNLPFRKAVGDKSNCTGELIDHIYQKDAEQE
ncbi:MAG: hypothetical protein GF398_05085 [Chitinivibrionales bacterium]|nr:hypothetical protein [Chitinivibrionales bacterium]